MRNEPPLFPHERWLRAGCVGILIIALVLVALIKPGSVPFYSKLPCGFHMLTGLPCPLCGATRASRALLHGDLHRALYLNAAALPALIAFLGMIGILLLEAIIGWRLGVWKFITSRSSRIMPVLLWLFVIWWIAHIIDALRIPKTQLVNLKNPIAEKLRYICTKR